MWVSVSLVSRPPGSPLSRLILLSGECAPRILATFGIVEYMYVLGAYVAYVQLKIGDPSYPVRNGFIVRRIVLVDLKFACWPSRRCGRFQCFCGICFAVDCLVSIVFLMVV